MKIPAQYLPVMPYIILDRADDFLQYCKSVFDAREQLIVPGDGERSIMHGEIRIGDGVIMFAGAGPQWTQKNAGMFIYVEDVDLVYSRAVEAGSVSLYAPVQQEYGYTAGFEDPFGNQWYIVAPEQ